MCCTTAGCLLGPDQGHHMQGVLVAETTHLAATDLHLPHVLAHLSLRISFDDQVQVPRGIRSRY
jgi:hypothetical protein